MSNRIAKHLDQIDADVVTTPVKSGSEDFKNVSKEWYRKTHPFSYAHDMIAKGRETTEDIKATLDEMVPGISDDGRIIFRYQDSREFAPTQYALAQIAGRADLSTTITTFLSPKIGPAGRVKYERDRGDMEVVLHMLENGLRADRVSHEKEFLWRCNTADMSIRAMLTDQYMILDNDWLLGVFEKAIPDGRISHMKGDSDTFYTNILIPDSMRQEKDSLYGAMISTGNSEIGERKASAINSLYRHICGNGMILGQQKGSGLCKVHRGKQIDLFDLERTIIEGLNEQIPLIPQGIDKLLNTRKFAWDGFSVLPMIAAVSKQFTIDKKQTTAILEGYHTEVNETSINANTLFGLINGVTRAAQEFDPATWTKLNTIGGSMVEMSEDRWGALKGMARAMPRKEVESAFSEN